MSLSVLVQVAWAVDDVSPGIRTKLEQGRKGDLAAGLACPLAIENGTYGITKRRIECSCGEKHWIVMGSKPPNHSPV